MATWKKVIVSGSAVTQLDFTSSTVLSGSMASNLPSGVVSGSAQTIENLPSGVVSGSAQTIANLPAGSVSGSSQTIENLVGSTILSGSITNILPSGVVSGSAQTIENLPSGVVSGSAQTIENLPAGSVSGSTQTIENLVGSTILSGSISTLLPSGVVSGSAQTIENLPSGVVSGSAQTIENLVGSTILSGSLPDDFITSINNTTGQTGITLGVTGGVLSATAVGLDTTNNVEFTNLTVSGDLEVAGTASFKHSSNLNVADQYISMNSGSTGAGLDSGGIVVLQDGAAGELFGWADASGDQRWGIKSSFNPGSTGDFAPEAFMSAVLPRAAATTNTDIITLGGGTAGQGYNKVGNIYTDEYGGIWIYSDESGA